MNYWRLSGFYLFYFATLGALVPYWSLYLKSLDFSVTEIGELTAILMATKIVAPYVWGWIADHTGRRIAIVASPPCWPRWPLPGCSPAPATGGWRW